MQLLASRMKCFWIRDLADELPASLSDRMVGNTSECTLAG